jgi:hypothetical protein
MMFFFSQFYIHIFIFILWWGEEKKGRKGRKKENKKERKKERKRGT